jgi:nitrate reductase NapE component
MNRVFARTEWVEFIIAAVVLWLLMMVAIQVLDLRTVT